MSEATANQALADFSLARDLARLRNVRRPASIASQLAGPATTRARMRVLPFLFGLFACAPVLAFAIARI